MSKPGQARQQVLDESALPALRGGRFFIGGHEPETAGFFRFWWEQPSGRDWAQDFATRGSLLQKSKHDSGLPQLLVGAALRPRLGLDFAIQVNFKVRINFKVNFKGVSPRASRLRATYF